MKLRKGARSSGAGKVEPKDDPPWFMVTALISFSENLILAKNKKGGFMNNKGSGTAVWIFFGGFVVLFSFIVFNARMERQAQLTPEQRQAQFQAELTEANRQADVATQLRGAEEGYLVEMRTGKLIRVCQRNGNRIYLCSYGNEKIEYWAKKVERVIGPDHKDWGKTAFRYLGGKRIR